MNTEPPRLHSVINHHRQVIENFEDRQEAHEFSHDYMVEFREPTMVVSLKRQTKLGERI